MEGRGAGPDPAREGTRPEVREVGGELRRLGELLATRDAPAEVLARVAEQLRTAAALLAGQPVQPRWYERSALGTADRGASRAYHDELGPLRGVANPIAPPLRFEPATRPDGRTAVGARVTLGPLHEGPPGIVHGGWLAALFDEVLAVVQRDAEIGGVTAQLTVRYRRPTPVGAELVFTGWIDDDAAIPESRSVVAGATCAVDGEVVATADAVFVRI